MAQQKQVAKRGVTEVPTFFKKEGDLGVNSISSEDTVMSRIKICQASSKNKKINPDLRDGDYYDNLTSKSFGSKLSIFILSHWSSLVWFSKDFKLRAVAIYDTKTRSYKGFGREFDQCVYDELEAGRKTQNYFVVTGKQLKDGVTKNIPIIPYIMEFSNMSEKSARQMNSKLRTNAMQGVPIYGQEIVLSTKDTSFSSGDAYMPVFSYGRYLTEPEYHYLKNLYEVTKALDKVNTKEQDNVAEDTNTEEVTEKAPF